MYLIIELQTNEEKETSYLVNTVEDVNEAESIFYQKLSEAAISSYPIHAVTLLTAEGETRRSWCYKHQVEEEEEDIQQ